MRCAVQVGFAVAFCLTLDAAFASAAPGDQTWTGTIRCDAIPHASTKPLFQRVTLQVSGGVARMMRNVFMADTGISSGYRETVEGRVGADGSLVLAGQGYALNSGYSVEYRGTLPADGRPTQLVGVQLWHFARLPPFERPCTIDLHRS